MKIDDVFTGLDSSRVDRIKGLIADLKSELDFLIKLTPEQRISANAVADGRLPFVISAQEYAEAYPKELMLDEEEQANMLRIFFDFVSMSTILHLLESLHEGVHDTTMQIGSNSFEKGLIVRNLAAVAIQRGVPGMEKVWDDLSRLFERGPRAKDENGDGNKNSPPPTE